MKKLYLLFAFTTTFLNVSSASFPVTEIQQTEIVRNSSLELPSYKSNNYIWGALSLFCALLSFFLIPNVLAIAPITFVGVIFGAVGFNKRLKGLAISGFVLSLLMLIISLVVILFIMLLG